MSREGQGSAAPKLRNGVMRRGSTWSYVIRVTDNSGVSKPRWVGGFSTEAAAKRARDEARIAASRGEFVRPQHPPNLRQYQRHICLNK